jgi:hypothetical protein
MDFAPEITWLFVTMYPFESRIAPEPFAVAFDSWVCMETTESDTDLATVVQSAVLPPFVVELPEPDLFEFTLARELVEGTVTQPFVNAAYPTPRHNAAATSAATTATTTLFAVLTGMPLLLRLGYPPIIGLWGGMPGPWGDPPPGIGEPPFCGSCGFCGFWGFWGIPKGLLKEFPSRESCPFALRPSGLTKGLPVKYGFVSLPAPLAGGICCVG